MRSLERGGVLSLVLACACSHASGSTPGGEALEAPAAVAPPAIGEAAADPASAAGAPSHDACGRRGAPDCPLQAWMKANLASRARDGQATELERPLGRLASLAPAGYADWGPLAASGAAAARAGDLDGARSACRACHEAYRDRYRVERRAAPVR